MIRQEKQLHARAHHGFTMIEMLVTVGIIIVLVSMAIYGLAGANNAAKRAETVIRIGAISNALQQYYNDFNRYPASYADATGGSDPYKDLQGAQLLAQALLGYMGGNADGAGTAKGDQNDYGFRLTKVTGTGKVYGPYITPDAKNFYAGQNVFVDSRGYAIFYYKAIPASRGKIARTTISNVFGTSTVDPLSASVTDDVFKALTGIFQAADNKTGWRNDVTSVDDLDVSGPQYTDFRKLLGDANGDNTLQAGDIIQGSDSFLLVAPGKDGIYFSGDDVISGAK